MPTSERPEAVRGGDADVLIVGYGPVGQVLANLLAQRGRTVTVLERWPQPYTMPRAVSFDGESARVLAAAGLGDFIGDVGESSRDYTWRNAAGEVLLHIDVAERGRCGWPDSISMYQPGLEAALAAHGATLPTLTVKRGWTATELIEDDGHVTVVAQETGGQTGGESGVEERVFTARWVVGCDGANSFVRDRVGTSATDYGFSSDWLICDVAPNEAREFRPNNLQVCDPERPSTSVSAGPGHRRWEFMRVPGESIEELDRPDTAWRLLDTFGIRPDNAVLERHAVYTFQARYADEWRSGRMLLAGDAVHLMPPFAGQGMCSGFRDAANLAWKLDLVLEGRADERLLDTYTDERRTHVQHAIGMSVNLGRIICQTDPAAAADRDVVMLAAKRRAPAPGDQQSPLQPLTRGFLHLDERRRPVAPAGLPVPQGRVTHGGREGLFDDVVGRGWFLLADGDPHALVDDACRAFLDGIGARLLRIVPRSTPATADAAYAADTVVDNDDVYLPFLTASRTPAVLVRPDFYVYGAVRDPAGGAVLVEGLRRLMPGSVLSSAPAASSLSPLSP